MKKILFIYIFVLTSVGFTFSQTTWSPVSPDFFPTNASGQIHGISRVSQVKFHPSNPSKMYAVSSRGGLFITTNGGSNWTIAPGCDLLPTMRLNSVCVDYTNDQVLYLGTGDANYYYTGSGVYKSTNGGSTFVSSGLGGRLITEIVMNPANNLMLIAATDAGIYKTIDGGATWVLKSASSLACRDLVFKANAGTRTLFASTYSDLYRSSDMGETWTQLTTGIYIPSGATTGGGCRVAVTPADSNLVYFHMVAKNGTVFKSTNGGNSFVNMKDSVMPNLTAYDNVATSTGQGDYNSMFNADPVNPNTLYYGSHGFWKSLDGGATWISMTFWAYVLHTDMHWVQVNPYNTSEIWTANDGGVWKSTNGGANWMPISNGIYGYEIYHGVCSPTRRDMFSIGTQDNGELYHSGSTWFTNRGGDWGSVCAFDYRSNSSMVYYLGNNKRRLVTGGDATYGLPDTIVPSLQDIGFSRKDPNLAFAGYQDVYRTTNLLNATPVWTQITAINKTIKAIHVNIADSNRLYVITNDANIYVSTNALSATPTFTNYLLPNSTTSVASIASIKSAPDVLYAVMNTRVYRSADNGATWTNVSSNLPSVNWVKIIPDEYFSANELVFVAGSNSVYYKKSGQANWTLFSTALPARTNINDFSVYDDGTNQSALRVSEYGRGMWEVPMTALRSVSAGFTADNVYPCAGGTVQFSDQSTGNVTGWTWTFPGGTPSSSTLQNPVVTYAVAGIYDVTLQVTDGITPNTLTKTAYINSNGAGLPLNEGFEGSTFPPAGFTSIDDGANGAVWQRSSSAGGFGLTSNSMFFDNYGIDVAGKKDEMRTTRFDIGGLTTATLTFDVAYQPYNTTNYSDSLQVLVSTNCGATFTSVYLKGGGTLSTVAGTNTSPFIPTSAQWRKETINLNAYIASGNVIVSFKNLGHYGNNLYIDNINLTGTFSTNAGPDRNICYGVNTTIGSAAIAGLTYSWSPTTGLSSSVLSNPTASPGTTTTYVLTATKIGSAVVARDTVIVTVDSVPINAVVNLVSCFGLNNGSITLSLNGGINPYSFLWNNGSTAMSRTGLVPGTYTVTITDGAPCSRVYSYVITQPAAALSASTSVTQSKCNLSNGAVTVIPSGGTSPYSYSWSNGASTATNSNLAPGTYTVVVTDARLCTTSATGIVTMKPLPVISSFTSSATTICSGLPFTLTVNSSGGTVTNSFSSGTINLPIPDNNANGVSTTIPVSSAINLTATSNLSVTLTFGTTATAPNREHTYVSDLKTTLTTPGGNTILFDRPGSNSADLNGVYTFTTSAASILPVLATDPAVVGGNIVAGNYKPSNSGSPDTAHNWAGLTIPFSINGNWILTIADLANTDVGDLISWTITITTPYSHVISGAGTIGAMNCLNSDCSNANSVITNAPVGTNIYTVTTTSPDGCTVSANRTVTVTAIPPQPGLITGVTQVCENDTINYSISSVPTATGYFWSFPSGWVIKSGQGTLTARVDPSVTNGNVSVTAINSCGSAVSQPLAVTTGFCTLNLTVREFIEGYFQSDSTMTSPLYATGNSASPNTVDSVLVELHDQFNPSLVVFNQQRTIDKDGIIQVSLPYSFNGGTYYIVVRHRNSLEVWSKMPVTLGLNTTYDFRY
jgi:PKD repeat protein/subtilisin-like proprotein convertase family protein